MVMSRELLGVLHIMNPDCELESVLVIIPVRDEETTIGRVIQKLQTMGLTQIRVVDNGSRDRTAVIARTWGAHVC
ncbi:MAG TPA: glycosyltransferase, partial [Elainellaceae cyanobacterium]